MADRKDTLQKLHTRVIDSLDGYKEARDNLDGGEGSGFVTRSIQERENFHAQIHQALAAEGIEVDEKGSTAAAAHRGLFKIRDALSSGDKGVMKECARGDKELHETYEDAIGVTDGDARWQFLVDQKAKVAASVSEAETLAA